VEYMRVGDSAVSVAPGSGEEPREITSMAAIASVTRQHRRGSDLNPRLDRLCCVVFVFGRGLDDAGTQSKWRIAHATPVDVPLGPDLRAANPATPHIVSQDYYNQDHDRRI